MHSYYLLPYYDEFNRPGNRTVVDASFDSNRSWNKDNCSSWQFRQNWTPHFLRGVHGYSCSCKTRQRPFRSLWPCLSCRRLKPLRHSCGKQSGHKSEHKSSCQLCFWSSLGLDSNQFPLKMCYLCRQQQPPCGETATPSRRQSIYHNLLQEGCVADGHCCRAWRSQKVCPLFLILLLSWRPEKDSKNEKQNKMKATLTCSLLASKQTHAK